MIKYDSNTIFIIGGFQNGIISRQTWIMDTSEGFQFREGPTLNINRYGHSCGKLISNNGDILIVAAGGRDDSNYLDSVEILDPISNRGWKLGKSKIYLVSTLNYSEIWLRFTICVCIG